MQPKESKNSRHFFLSLAKSILRLGGCQAIYMGNLGATAAFFATAEILGVMEEL